MTIAPKRPTPSPSDLETDLDPRLNAFRADLADARLRDQVRAAHFVEPMRAYCAAAATPMLRAPDVSAMQTSALLAGEAVAVFDTRDGFAWVQALSDGYVGYVEASALGKTAPPAPTHRVAVPMTHLYPEPSVKVRPLGPRFGGTAIALADRPREKAFEAVEGGGWIAADHLVPLAGGPCPPVDIAERFLRVPYLWGGRTGAGIDCSGLVQTALLIAGIDCPRDSDMQAAELGVDIGRDLAALRRGDLVFFPGHVGFMVDAIHLLHANATRMCVSIDPLETVIGWVTASATQPIQALKRLTV